jgi:hypothetical protein
MDAYLIRVDVVALESCLTSKESRAVRRGAVGKVPAQVTRWPSTLLQARFGGGRMEKDAAGYLSLLSHDRLTNPGTSRTSPAAYPT